MRVFLAVILTTAVGVLAFAVYSNTLGHGFVWDDQSAIINNRGVKPTTSLATVWTDDYWGTPMHSPDSHKSYRPVTTMSFRLSYALAGGTREPWTWHMFNVLAHAVATVLLQFLLLEALGDLELATVTSLLFATHPVHVEAVANLANGRAETLCAIGMFGCVLCHLRDARHAPKPKVPAAAQPGWMFAGLGWRLVGAVMFAMAALSKEIGLTAVGITMVYDALALSHAINGPAVAQTVMRALTTLHLGPLARMLTFGSPVLCDAAHSAGSVTTSTRQRSRGAGGTKANAPPSAWSVCLNRNMLLWASAFAILALRKSISGDGTMPEIPWRDRPQQFVKDPVLRFLSVLHINAEHLVRMLLPIRNSVEVGWSSIKPIGTHGSVFDARLLFPLFAMFALVSMGLRALAAQLVDSDDLDMTKHKKKEGGKKSKDSEGRTNGKGTSRDDRDAGTTEKLVLARSTLLGFLLLVVPFIPASGILGTPGFTVAERVLYTPLAGFCLLVALGLRIFVRRWWLRAPLVFVLAAAYSFRTWQRNPDWASSPKLWASEYKINPDCAHARISQGQHVVLGYDYNHRTGSYEYDPALMTPKNLLAAIDFQLGGLELCPEDADAYDNVVNFAKQLSFKFQMKEEAVDALKRLREQNEKKWKSRRKDLAWSIWCETHPRAECTGPTHPMYHEVTNMIEAASAS